MADMGEFRFQSLLGVSLFFLLAAGTGLITGFTGCVFSAFFFSHLFSPSRVHLFSNRKSAFFPFFRSTSRDEASLP
jgi:hypothetical protein